MQSSIALVSRQGPVQAWHPPPHSNSVVRGTTSPRACDPAGPPQAVGESVKLPVAYYENNFVGSVNLIKAMSAVPPIPACRPLARAAL
jgi:hypothetical protein